MNRRHRVPAAAVTVGLILLVLCPVIFMVQMSLRTGLEAFRMPPTFPFLPTFQNYAALFEGKFVRSLVNSVVTSTATTAIFTFLLSWNDFFYSLLLTRSSAVTAPVAIVNFMNYESWEWGKVASAATVIMLPVVALSIVVRKYLVRGLTAGAVRG